MEYPTRLRNGLVKEQIMWRHAAVEMASGRVVRTALWRYPLKKFEIDYGVVDDKFLHEVLDFYHAARGFLYEFAFQNWLRPHPQDVLLGYADGMRSVFKVHGDAFDSVVVRVNGESAPVSAWDAESGFIMLVSPPAAGLAVRADVVNERYRVMFSPEPLEYEHIGGQAYQLQVALIQAKVPEDLSMVSWTPT